MAHPSRRLNLRHLFRRFGPSDGAVGNDHQLLERFCTQRDEAAFAQVVHRHGPLVRRVARRLLGQAADADDVFCSGVSTDLSWSSSFSTRWRNSNCAAGAAARPRREAQAALERLRSRPTAQDQP